MRHAIRVLTISMSLFALFTTGAQQSVVFRRSWHVGRLHVRPEHDGADRVGAEFMGALRRSTSSPSVPRTRAQLPGFSLLGWNRQGGRLAQPPRRQGDQVRRRVRGRRLRERRQDRSTVKRRIDPIAVADELAILVRHAITGVDPAAKAAEDRVSGFDGGGVALMDDEEDDFDDDELLMAAPAAAPMTMGDSDPLEDDFIDEDPEEDGYGRGAAMGAAAGAATAAAVARDGT